MNKKLFLIVVVLLLLSCNLPTPTSPVPIASPTSVVTLTPAPALSPTAPNDPGLVVHGQVTFNGVGLAGVKIYKRFNAYPPDLIATTDVNGYYESDFIYIPGDETVSVQAELAGYTFEPPDCHWRHYYGYENTGCDFTATQAP
ncbi:MAG: hypothetical protein QM730_09705 [Anaerolineales bacterium]